MRITIYFYVRVGGRRFSNLRDVLYDVRVHDESVSSTHSDQQARNSAIAVVSAIERDFERPVPLDQVINLQALTARTSFHSTAEVSGRAVLDTAKLLLELCQSVLLKSNDFHSKSLIKRDTTDRLFQLATNSLHYRQPEGFLVLAQSMLINPFRTLALLSNKFRQKKSASSVSRH